ncbi:short-chain dehydrogenase [Massilia sp. KIM]|uniref:SDR family oxidoreductase n=1 Tax=Massilia sp. KIM TaxID=1955422 RepID=UPI00098EB932|nr:SDR family NAD(P)-dependent oxidoreductase [Massilia sp. KIM]OON62553.1 short-chain dehydrogenase [Massilia sp. KIM]
MQADSKAASKEARRELKDKVALVTGGASGLGAALCAALAEAGARVVVADVHEDRAADHAGSLRAAGGQAGHALLDVRDPQAGAVLVERIVARDGRLDILVNNAGTDSTRPCTELSPDEWRRIVDTNLNGPFYLARAAIAPMRAAGGGHIVNITSTAAKRAWPNAAAYHASKWGLLGLSHALHAELRAEGIKVTAVVAGGMRTPFLLDRFPELDPGLLQDPADVARAILPVLCMPAGSVIPELTVLPMRETSWP